MSQAETSSQTCGQTVDETTGSGRDVSERRRRQRHETALPSVHLYLPSPVDDRNTEWTRELEKIERKEDVCG